MEFLAEIREFQKRERAKRKAGKRVPTVAEKLPAGMARLIHESIAFECAAFEDGQYVSGADLLDWFCDWRKRVIAECNKPAGGA
jgi:hypothetical protein